MNNFDEIKKNAERSRRIGNEVIDNFLIYYAASKDRLDKIFEKKAKRYRHITLKMPKEWKNMLKSAFIAHQIFKQEGLIRKYLNHAEVNYRNNHELEFLKLQKKFPWRYSFSRILDNPHPDFYTMHDIFTGQKYLLYSRGISNILLVNRDIEIWFNLIGFDGMCMQTYGTICYFKSFERPDIEFFARLLEPNLESNAAIVDHIEKNPLPYSMLWSGAEIPVLRHDNHIIKQYAARYFDDNFSSEPFKDRFKIEYAQSIYRLPLKGWGEFPHFAVAYYDEEEQTLHLTSMTMKGFEKLVENMNACGYDLPPAPRHEVNMSMLSTASDILKKEITTNPFDSYFIPEDEDDEDLDEVNRYLDLLMNKINSGEKPDIKKMADAASIDYETAADLAEAVIERMETNLKKYGK